MRMGTKRIVLPVENEVIICTMHIETRAGAETRVNFPRMVVGSQRGLDRSRGRVWSVKVQCLVPASLTRAALSCNFLCV